MGSSSEHQESDLSVNTARFVADAAAKETLEFNENLVEIMKKIPNWWEVGAPRYREMRTNGETPLPKPTILDHGKNSSIPSRDEGREIPVRIFEPAGDVKSEGVFMHIHGGGWCLQTESTQDWLLEYLATTTRTTVVSVGYRLAPEHPFPAGNEDCYDAASYFATSSRFTKPLLYIGGESAGGHLSVATILWLRKHKPDFHFKGAMLTYGAYELAMFFPQCTNFRAGQTPLILGMNTMIHYREAFLPGTNAEQRRAPEISPFYADLAQHAPLPAAFFSCGTQDPLLDDTLMMATRWGTQQSKSRTRIYEGACHGFNLFKPEQYSQSAKWRADFEAFVKWLDA